MTPLGEFHLSGDDNIYFSMYGKANSVTSIIGTIEEKYKYESILLSKKNIKKMIFRIENGETGCILHTIPGD